MVYSYKPIILKKGIVPIMKAKDLQELKSNYLNYLKIEEERSVNTLKQYERAINVFIDYLDSNGIEEVTKEVVNQYKTDMLKELEENRNTDAPPVNGKRPLKTYNTLNQRIRTLNALLTYSGHPELKTKQVKDMSKNTNKGQFKDADYLKLLEYIDKHSNEKIKLIVETLMYTGIRISELEGITVEALRHRMPEVYNKGKNRTIYIPKGLARKLKAYAKKNGITKGIIFRSRPLKDENGELLRDKNGDLVYKLITQSYIRDEIKRVAGLARMKKSIIHPHVLRHLFAQHYAKMPNNNAYALSDILGHGGGIGNDVTALYTRLDPVELLVEVDKLEVYVNKELLPQAKKKREVAKRKAQQNRERMSKKK